MCTTDGVGKVISGYQKSVDDEDACKTACATFEWCKGYRINTKGTQCRLLTSDKTVTDSSLDGEPNFYNPRNWAEPDDWKGSSIYTDYKCYKKSS